MIKNIDMKKYLFPLYLIAVFFGCNSNKLTEPSPEFYIYATIDGQSFKYEGQDYTASNMPNSGYPSFYLGVFPEDFKALSFGTKGPLTGKPENFEILASYHRKSRYEEFAAGIQNSSGKPTNGKCSITKIDDHIVEGTFSFDAYSENGKGNIRLSVTNGRFRVKY